ncbi:Conserved_hypothetical protein [Hexamita inflata]|uniref:Uncharacterized protein n=1 Tax=Hexamita inflata TaxID=28002 RepID=A0ABP1HH28_9EUKA
MTDAQKTTVKQLEIQIKTLSKALQQQHKQHKKEKDKYIQEFIEFRDMSEQRLHNVQKYYCRQLIRLFSKQEQQEVSEHVEELIKQANIQSERIKTLKNDLIEAQQQIKEQKFEITTLKEGIEGERKIAFEKDKMITDLEIALSKYKSSSNLHHGANSDHSSINKSSNEQPLSGNVSNVGNKNTSKNLSRNLQKMSSQFNLSHTQQNVSIMESVEYIQSHERSASTKLTYDNMSSFTSQYMGQPSTSQKFNVNTVLCGDEYDYNCVEIHINEPVKDYKETQNPTIKEEGYVFVSKQKEENPMFSFSDSSIAQLDTEDAFDEKFGKKQKMKELQHLLHNKHQILNNIQLNTDNELYLMTILPWIIDLEQTKQVLTQSYNALQLQYDQLFQDKERLIRQRKEKEAEILIIIQKDETIQNNLETNIQTLKQQLEDQQDQYSQLCSEKQDIQNNLQEEKQLRQNFESQLLQLQTQLSVKEQEQQFVQTQLDALKKEIEEGHVMGSNIQTVIEEDNKLKQDIERYQEVNKIQDTELKQLCVRIKFLEFTNYDLRAEVQKLSQGKQFNSTNSAANPFTQQQLDKQIQNLQDAHNEIRQRNEQIKVLEQQSNQISQQYNIQSMSYKVLKRRYLALNERINEFERKADEAKMIMSQVITKCQIVVSEKDQVIIDLNNQLYGVNTRQMSFAGLQDDNKNDNQSSTKQLSKLENNSLKKEGSIVPIKDCLKPNQSSVESMKAYNNKSIILQDMKSIVNKSVEDNIVYPPPKPMNWQNSQVSLRAVSALSTKSISGSSQENPSQINGNYDMFFVYQEQVKLNQILDEIKKSDDNKTKEFTMQIIQQQDELSQSYSCSGTQTEALIALVVPKSEVYCQHIDTNESKVTQTDETKMGADTQIKMMKEEIKFLYQKLFVFEQAKATQNVGEKIEQNFQIYVSNQNVYKERSIMAMHEVQSYHFRLEKKLAEYRKHKCPGIERFAYEIEVMVQERSKIYLLKMKDMQSYIDLLKHKVEEKEAEIKFMEKTQKLTVADVQNTIDYIYLIDQYKNPIFDSKILKLQDKLSQIEYVIERVARELKTKNQTIGTLKSVIQAVNARTKELDGEMSSSSDALAPIKESGSQEFLSQDLTLSKFRKPAFASLRINTMQEQLDRQPSQKQFESIATDLKNTRISGVESVIDFIIQPQTRRYQEMNVCSALLNQSSLLTRKSSEIDSSRRSFIQTFPLQQMQSQLARDKKNGNRYYKLTLTYIDKYVNPLMFDQQIQCEIIKPRFYNQNKSKVQLQQKEIFSLKQQLTKAQERLLELKAVDVLDQQLKETQKTLQTTKKDLKLSQESLANVTESYEILLNEFKKCDGALEFMLGGTQQEVTSLRTKKWRIGSGQLLKNYK